MKAPIVVWEPAGRITVAGAEVGAARFLAAETASGGAILLAAADAGDDALLLGQLPQGARAATLLLAADGALQEIRLHLDDAFAPDAANLAPDVDLIALREDGGALRPVREAGSEPLANHDPSVKAFGLNRASSDYGLTRVSVGPFLDPADIAARRVDLWASVKDGRLSVALSRPPGARQSAEPEIVFVHAAAAWRKARRILAETAPAVRSGVEAALDELIGRPAETDMSGADPVAARRRGFALLRPKLADNADGCFASLEIDGWSSDDLLLAIPISGARVALGDLPAGPAALAIAETADGFVAEALERAYAPAKSFGLAASASGGGSLAAYDGSANIAARDDVAMEAVALVRGLSAAGRGGAQAPALVDWPATGRPAGPLSALSARAVAEGRSILEFAPLPEGVAEELDDRPPAEQAAMIALAVDNPGLAARACAARLIPPPSPDKEFGELLAWFEPADAPARLAREAMAGYGLDRAGVRLLHEVAASAHSEWLDHATALEAFALSKAARASAPPAARRTELDALVIRAREMAGAPKQETPLEQLAEMRADLSAAALRSGQSEALRAELAKRLLSLTPQDIVAIHRLFDRTERAERLKTSARGLIERWEAASGRKGLAAARDRGGDPLKGAGNLAGHGTGLAGEFGRIEALAPLLAALRAQILEALGDHPDLAAETTALRRSLDAYGLLLALDLIRAEADATLAAAKPPTPPAAAARERLRSGLPETLERYLALANPEAEAVWGGALIEASAGPDA